MRPCRQVSWAERRANLADCCLTLFLASNVANLFTPQGDGDPLALLPMVVGLWQ